MEIYGNPFIISCHNPCQDWFIFMPRKQGNSRHISLIVIIWNKLIWNSNFVKSNAYSHLSTVIQWMLKCLVNSWLIAFWLFLMLDLLFPCNWRISETCLNLTASIFSEFIKLLTVCVVFSCILSTNLKYIMAYYYYDIVFSEVMKQIKSHEFYHFHIVSHDFKNTVHVYSGYLGLWLCSSQCHMQCQFS